MYTLFSRKLSNVGSVSKYQQVWKSLPAHTDTNTHFIVLMAYRVSGQHSHLSIHYFIHWSCSYLAPVVGSDLPVSTWCSHGDFFIFSFKQNLIYLLQSPRSVSRAAPHQHMPNSFLIHSYNLCTYWRLKTWTILSCLKGLVWVALAAKYQENASPSDKYLKTKCFILPCKYRKTFPLLKNKHQLLELLLVHNGKTNTGCIASNLSDFARYALHYHIQ